MSNTFKLRDGSMKLGRLVVFATNAGINRIAYLFIPSSRV